MPTTQTFDGLDRVTNVTRPEGIAVDYEYDRASRLLEYRDARQQETAYTYDNADRPLTVTYPDQTVLRYAEYDEASNPTGIVEPRGSQIAQQFDHGNRLLARQITRGTGVEGVTSEAYVHDGSAG